MIHARSRLRYGCTRLSVPCYPVATGSCVLGDRRFTEQSLVNVMAPASSTITLRPPPVPSDPDLSRFRSFLVLPRLLNVRARSPSIPIPVRVRPVGRYLAIPSQACPSHHPP